MHRFNSCYSGKRRDAHTREEQLRNNIAALGQSVGSSSRDTQNHTFELFCRYWHPNDVGEINHMLPTSTETPDPLTRRLRLTPTYLTTNQSEKWPQADHALWAISIKLSLAPPGRTHSFEGINPPWPPLPCKTIKLLFSTLPKLYPRGVVGVQKLDSASVPRNWFEWWHLLTIRKHQFQRCTAFSPWWDFHVLSSKRRWKSKEASKIGREEWTRHCPSTTQPHPRF